MNEYSELTSAGPVAREGNRDKAQRLAAGLSKLGIVAGDRIALVTAGEIEHVDAMIACSLLGAVFVSVDPRASTDELAEELAGFACKGVIAADYALAPIVAVRERIDTLRWVVGISTARGKSTPAQLQARGVRPYAELAATDLITRTV
jgi:acyl-coenzyme A synthetase/AMP-(fatty) acid ligase